MSACYAQRANAMELQAAGNHRQDLERAVALMRSRVRALAEERAGIRGRTASFHETTRDDARTRVNSRRFLMEEHSRLQSELAEARSEHEAEVVRLESEINGIDDQCTGPKADVAEASVLHKEQLALEEAWKSEAKALDAHRVNTLRVCNNRLAELGMEMEQERRLSQRRGRTAAARGEKVVAAARAEVVMDEKRSAQQNQEEALQGSTDEKRLRIALKKTAQQLGGHRARNLNTEEAIARALTEKEVQNATLEEMSMDVERLHQEHVMLAREL